MAAYSGSAISRYRDDQFNTNIDQRINERTWLAGKVFLFKLASHQGAWPR